MARTGKWDPDGRGIRKAPDEFAEMMKDRNSQNNLLQVSIPLVLTWLFYISPW